MSTTDGTRLEKLSKYLTAVLNGKRRIDNPNDARRLFEAISCQDDRTMCVERLLASQPALEAVKNSVRCDASPDFLNKCMAGFVLYFSDPLIKQLCSGQYLQRIVLIIADPPTVVNELLRHLNEHSLEEQAVHALAWLLYELLNLPHDIVLGVNAFEIAQRLTSDKAFVNSTNLPVRTLGHKIEKLLHLKTITATQPDLFSPGGRHDNDHADFRKISVLPTSDELLSTEPAFYRRSDAILEHDASERPVIHLDNQFRLLREDMLAELRLDLQVARGQTKAKRHVTRLAGLTLDGVFLGEDRRRKASALCFRCASLPGLPSLDSPAARKKFLIATPTYLKYQSFGCLLQGNDIVAFGTLERDVDLLAADEPILVLRVSDAGPLGSTLLAAKMRSDFQFLLVGTPIFAYAPVLRRLQEMTTFPLDMELVAYDKGQAVSASPFDLSSICQKIRVAQGRDMRSILNLQKDVDLDPSQTRSLLAGLESCVSLIQGPPGTGKSFIGALLAKAVYENTNETMLVLCFTNHALDQFLEDLLDIGIPGSAMVRLGSKSSARTEALKLSGQQRGRPSRHQFNMLDGINSELFMLDDGLNRKFERFKHFNVSDSQIMEHLEFSDEASFYDAFDTPTDQNGMSIVGRDGRAIKETYLLDRWRRGLDAGVIRNRLNVAHSSIWQMSKSARDAQLERWQRLIFKDEIDGISRSMAEFDQRQRQIHKIFGAGTDELLKTKRLIGCTTTGAAMYASQLLNAAPGVIIVEEAGEILESHILSAMTEHTKQLVMIGDHKQLRPKVNNYQLTVEKGQGYDLNKSMFERLVLGGFPHQTLHKQHRMPPELSAIVRHLTYPDLEDAPETLQRESLHGLQNRIIFFNHEHPEEEQAGLLERRDEGAKASKRNEFEAKMVLSTVRYLAQQGYGTDKIVVLTPYLGQLSLLKDKLSTDVDPVLGDLDSYDLVAAGLMTPASAAHGKRSLRMSTIDNYQGEESDIVVTSLVRSNSQGDIGFMSSPQRLNVLLSRARIGLIMIGNSATFLNSKKGADTWMPFFDFMKHANYLYDGIPVICQRHPTRTFLMKTQDDFAMHCPDGGCSDPCGTLLNCGLHLCPQSCHLLFDHSKIDCKHVVDFQCPKGHKRKIECCQQKAHKCGTCSEEARKQEARRRRDLKLDEARDEKLRKHARQLVEIQDEIEEQKRLLKDGRDVQAMKDAVQQHKKDLESMKEAVNSASTLPSPLPTSPDVQSGTANNAQSKSAASSPSPGGALQPSGSVSVARDEWQHRKSVMLERNDALDKLMDMIGLENVKEEFLCIKDRIDMAVRQNVDLQNERFSASLLGNPGTGKTTVARLYAQFLTSVGALPGDFFKETTGSSLASDGVPGCKKIVEEILNSGGGALFIDEAYQLASGSSVGGKAVLDFLLAEVENYRGKIVFIIAGYNKQMEDFFAHNPGFPSRFPNTLQFRDYDDGELRQILQYQVEKKYGGRMRVEGGITGLFARIVSRKVGRGRGREGFGNARAIENTLAIIEKRQAKRIRQERRAGTKPSDLSLLQEDLIGPEPSGILNSNTSWQGLLAMIGLKSVKESLQALFSSIELNYHRELEEKPMIEFNLNRVFVGSPGTGKTTVAKLYGQVLSDLGLLSNGEVVIKTPADFIGAHIGESEKNTKGILASTVGKVLVIDEAYGLHSTISGGADPYKTAIIDTIVGEVQSTPGEDRCVLLLGYRDEMQAMLQAANPGLSRRFPIDSAFDFEDFTDDELGQILDIKVKQQGFVLTDQGRRVAMKILQRARNRPNFGNAGEVDIILNQAKFRQQKRIARSSRKDTDTLEARDLDEDFDREARAATNISLLFKDVVGGHNIVQKLEGYQRTASNMQARNMDPREQLPFNFLFRGPPGTGKTTTARKMGKVYYDMGFLASAEVVECSASELVGEYVGHTGPKTQKMLEKALGKVLFIDEAYRLADGAFAKEAMDEIVDCLTKPKYAQKLVVILAGYDQDINRLMSMNPGLTSRFPETISFENMDSDTCITLLAKLMERRKKDVDCSILCTPSDAFRRTIQTKFQRLSEIDNWANARDVQTLNKAIFNKLLAVDDQSATRMILTEQLVCDEVDAMIKERDDRARNLKPSKHQPSMPLLSKNPGPPPSITPAAPNVDFKTEHAQKVPDVDDSQASVPGAEGIDLSAPPKDPGVSDEAWQQLENDKKAAIELEALYQKSIQEEALARDAYYKAIIDEERAAHQLRAAIEAEKIENDNRQAEEDRIKEIQRKQAAVDEAKRRRERERVQHELNRRVREDAEFKARQEVVAQTKLRRIGVCIAGYIWTKQASGYRCAGGSHFVSDADLDKMSA